MRGMSKVCLLPLLTAAAAGQERLTPDTVVVFAGSDESRELLGRRDDFVRRMSPLDRAARLRSGRAVSEDEYRHFVQQHVLDWTAEEQAKVSVALQAIRQKLTGLNPPWPAKIRLIKTSGEEEGAAAYTRSTAVVLPQDLLQRYDQTALQKLICHELFHVLSRYKLALRERLYAVIGFHRCPALALPPPLADRRIANPDAPPEEYFIRVRLGGESVAAVPLLVRRDDSDDPPAAGAFFDYFHLRLLIVSDPEQDGRCVAALEDGQPRLVPLNAVADFYEQVGRNTRYVIHPDEILADNFALLVLAESDDHPSPQILDQMRRVLQTAGEPQQPAE